MSGRWRWGQRRIYKGILRGRAGKREGVRRDKVGCEGMWGGMGWTRRTSGKVRGGTPPGH